MLLPLFLLLSGAYSSLVPLGEAPDEPAQLSYARYIAENGQLPATLPDRQAAGYRSAWPPLYHFLVAGPLVAVGDAPPTRLKAVGDSPRRLIPTNGQTIAAFIHTADEAWPWRGLPLAWHLGRFLSVGLAALSVVTTYAVAWRLTDRRSLALGAAALQATIPQYLFVSSVINDDNLLILISGLVFFILVDNTRRATLPGLAYTFLLGSLLGLASVTKYNALPLWALTVVWGGWLIYSKGAAARLPKLLGHSAALLGGAALTGGWWFIFIWRHFNQVASQGWLAGSLAALTAGTADASLRQLSQGFALTLPSADRWLVWWVTLFQSFWGLFGGGSTIPLPGWIYWLLALICLGAVVPYLLKLVSGLKNRHLHPPGPLPGLFLLAPLFFLPLPLLRFILIDSIVETAQGRHLFPALPAITLALIWGLAGLARSTAHFLSRFRLQAPRLPALTLLAFPLLTAILSLYSLSLILASYPPPIPLWTTPDAATAENQLEAQLAEGINLVGYDLGWPENNILPLILVWQAETVPPEDYLIDLSLVDSAGQPVGGWIGQPIGGRYPTRAWDPGDILQDAIPVPLLSTRPATLTLRLLDPSGQATADPLVLASRLDLPPLASQPLLPPQLRADGLPPAQPFNYRSTLSFRLPPVTATPKLIGPGGRRLPPDQFLSGSEGSLAHFIVKAAWPAGQYQLSVNNYQLTVDNRPRQFEPPPMDRPVKATFANRLTLLGYDMPQQRVQPGESFPITLHLRAEQTMGQNLVLFNHLLDQEAGQRGGVDRIPQKYYTTLLWAPGEIVSDSYQVPVDPDAPPGIYRLDVGFYPADHPTFSLPLTLNGEPIDQNSVRLGPIKVGGPPPGLTVTQANPQHPLEITFGNWITLLGFNFAATAAESGVGSPLLTLFWKAEAVPPADYTVFVHLLDPAGNLIAQADSPPAGGAYPTSLWDPGEIIIDSHPLGNLPSGRYTLQVGLYHPETGARLPVVDSPDGSVTLLNFEVEK